MLLTLILCQCFFDKFLQIVIATCSRADFKVVLGSSSGPGQEPEGRPGGPADLEAAMTEGGGYSFPRPAPPGLCFLVFPGVPATPGEFAS